MKIKWHQLSLPLQTRNLLLITSLTTQTIWEIYWLNVASQIVADVGAMNMTPEQLGEFLALIQSGNLNELLSGKTKVVTTVNSSEVNEEENEDLYEDEEEENNED